MTHQKWLLKFAVILFAASVLGSCADEVGTDIKTDVSSEHIKSTRSTENETSNFVSYSDVAKLTGVIGGEQKGQRNRVSFKLSCIVDSQCDTLLYVLDKSSGGWNVYSSDKRTPHIVAYSDTGSFSDLMKIEGVEVWLQSIATDMKIVKKLDDNQLSFSKSEIDANLEFWKSVTEPSQYVVDLQSKSKKIVKLDTTKVLPHPFFPKGHYEYAGSDSYWEDYDEIPRLTSTNWHQSSPFNIYCPRKVADIGRAPAGCVAISAAQMLYFLHHKFGVPRTAPSKAYCNGYVNSKDYDWAQTDYNSEIWDKMKWNDRDAAPLIADIGRRVGMKYGDSQSSAATKDLVEKVFKPYGVESTYAAYNENLVKSNLTHGLPVIVSAYTNIDGQTKPAGHSFIVDRYKRTREVVVSRYKWHYDYVPEKTLIENIRDSLTVSYRTPEITMIGMNWGWNPYQVKNEDGWFALTGDWYVKSGDQEMHWNIMREMLYINAIKF